jgi:hypothetical protein
MTFVFFSLLELAWVGYLSRKEADSKEEAKKAADAAATVSIDKINMIVPTPAGPPPPNSGGGIGGQEDEGNNLRQFNCMDYGKIIFIFKQKKRWASISWSRRQC